MTKELSKTPHDIHSQLVATIGISKKSFIAIGKLLSDLKKEDLFKQAVGEGIDTWADYVAQPEVSLSIGEANRLIQIYDEFVARLGFDANYIAEVPLKNIHYLLPIVKKMNADDNVDDLLADAKSLSQKDFKERVYDVRSGDVVERTYEYMIMKKCVETGNMTKVHGIESELIKRQFNLENEER